MRKLFPTCLQAAAASLIALLVVAVSLAIAPSASAGSSGCDALRKAAKKGFRGDPSALVACEDAAKGAAHAARAKPHALQSQHDRDQTSSRRQMRQLNKALKSHDTRTLAQMRGRTSIHRAGSGLGRQLRDKQTFDDAVNLMIILRSIESGGGH